MQPPNLHDLVPKTITSLGNFNYTINLSNLFDVFPLVENDDFKFIRIKYDGIMRDIYQGGLPSQSDNEFKNSITLEIEDKETSKIRAVKLNCRGFHMCGNRSIKRSKNVIEMIVDLIYQTDSFLKRIKELTWDKVQEDSFFPQMQNTLLSILPPNYTDVDTLALLNFLKSIREQGGVYNCLNDKEPLSLVKYRTVMINFGYKPEGVLDTKSTTKDEFIERILRNISKMKDREFDIWVDYDNLMSSVGWSGSIPLRLLHKSTQESQWITLQLRRGTVVHSGPNIPIMQKAVNLLYELFRR